MGQLAVMPNIRDQIPSISPKLYVILLLITSVPRQAASQTSLSELFSSDQQPAEPQRSIHKRIASLTPVETCAFHTAIENDRQGSLFGVAIATGLGQAELFSLRWPDVDLNKAS